MTMPCDSLKLILDFASPLVDGVQTAIVAWVAYRVAGTSKAVQSTSAEVLANSDKLSALQELSEWDPAAPDRRKS